MSFGDIFRKEAVRVETFRVRVVRGVFVQAGEVHDQHHAGRNHVLAWKKENFTGMYFISLKL